MMMKGNQRWRWQWRCQDDDDNDDNKNDDRKTMMMMMINDQSLKNDINKIQDNIVTLRIH